MRQYYTLVIRHKGRWAPQFGSYVYGECLSERDACLDHGEKLKNMKIITTSPEQTAIDLRVKELNQ
jgi:hypothetical protein